MTDASEVRTDADRPQAPRRHTLVPALVVAALLVGGLAAGALRGGTPQAPSTPTRTAAPSTPGPSAPSTDASTDGQKSLIRSVQRREKDDPYALGRVDAPVVLVEFSDWRCPFCALWAKTTRPALQKYVDDGTLRIEYRDMPIFGEQSELAARAGRAAGAQGRFWAFYDTVFAAAPERGHPDLTQKAVTDLARKAGVPDMKKFESDLASTDLDHLVKRDLEDARRLGAPGSVPLFLIGDEALSGAQPTEVFEEAVRRQAAAARS